jgi:hypothetical protein
VYMTVATAFAVSWKPLIASKKQTETKQMINRRDVCVERSEINP